MNWIISFYIYAILFVIMAFFVVGVPLLVALAICGLIFPIIGAIKAGGNICWHYPLTINFLGIPNENDEP